MFVLLQILMWNRDFCMMRYIENKYVTHVIFAIVISLKLKPPNRLMICCFNIKGDKYSEKINCKKL